MGLRERKKRQTAQLISDVASALFIQRGFDNVTVAEIAEATGVSTKTVFNYFPRKEDLFLDRFPEAVDLMTKAVLERPEGEEPEAALRRLFLGLLERRHPLAGVGPGYERFWRVVAESPALRARARELAEETEDVLAGLFAEAWGAAAADPLPRMAAALVAAAYRTVYLTGLRRLLAGDSVETVLSDHVALLNHAFDAVDQALASLRNAT